MKIYDLAVAEDCGTYWKVNGVTQNTMDYIENSAELLIRLSFLAAEQLKQAISENKIVHIPKANFRSVELLPGDFLIVDPETCDDPLQAHKDAVLVKYRSMITPILSKISGLTLYGFTVLNNDLASAGYFITNENREEKYLEILEAGNEKLISKLEDYLNYKDEIQDVAEIERQFSAFKNEVKLSDTFDELNVTEGKFLNKLQELLK
jgi:hypothetical protein